MDEKIKKIAEEKIWKVEKIVNNLPALPNTFTYVHIYQCLQELYFQGEYNIVINICDVLENR